MSSHEVAGTARVANAIHTQIRGGSIMLAGRIFALGVNFATQVLMVRYLATADYGALAYALSVGTFLQIFATLQLGEATMRFVSIYHAQHNYGRVFGIMLLAAGTMVLAGVAVSTVVTALPASVTRWLTTDQQPIFLLSILILGLPFGALDTLFLSLFAACMGPRAIFFRRYVLGPGLKLSMIILLIVWQRDVVFLAYGYLVVIVLNVLIYLWMFLRFLRTQGWLHHLRTTRLEFPVRELFGFALPLFGSQVLALGLSSLDVFFLGYFHNSAEVAFFRVVVTAAQLNLTVLRSLELLYVPAAARLFATQDYAGLRQLYIQTAGWMAVVTFPIFAVTFALAHPFTLWMYGERYAPASVNLALLACGYYCSVVLGFNSQTLKVLGKIRYVITIDIATGVVTVIVNLLLIARYGALGAAIGGSVSLMLYNLLSQAGLHWALGVHIFDRPYVALHATIACGVIGLGGILLVRPPGAMALVLVVFLSGGVFGLARKRLLVAATFPELLKVPLLGRLLR